MELLKQLEVLKGQLATIIMHINTNKTQLDLKDTYSFALYNELYVLLDKLQDKFYNNIENKRVESKEIDYKSYLSWIESRVYEINSYENISEENAQKIKEAFELLKDIGEE